MFSPPTVDGASTVWFRARHFKPLPGKRLLHGCYEYIFHFTKTGQVPLDRLAIGVPYQDKSNVTRWNGAGQDLRCRGNTWFMLYRTIRDRVRCN